MTMTIGKLAQRAGVGVETIRFYERKGLIETPLRTASGYRQYSEAVVRRLQFIRRAKELGFTLNEIMELLSLKTSAGVTCASVKQKAEKKIADIDGKLRSLRRMKRALVDLTQTCNGDSSLDECPILNAMDDGASLE